MSESDAGPGGLPLKLLERARKGDAAALGEIVTVFRPRMYAVAYRLTLNADDALDAVQEASLTLCRQLRRLRDEKALWAWLRRIVVNECLQQFRRRQAERERLETLGQEAELAAQRRASIVTLIQRGQQVERIERVLSEISPRQRVIFALRFYEEMSLEEIARELDLSVGAVKSHLFRAVHRLRQRLADDFGEGKAEAP